MNEIHIGDKFRVLPAFIGNVDTKNKQASQTGTVVYVHPQGRYAVLEFDGITGRPREGFHPFDLKGRSR